MILLKIIGLVLLFLGFLIIRYFPDTQKYQREGFLLSGLFVGAVLFVVGLALVIFG